MSLRIAQLMAGAPAGGAELFFERLSAALAQAGDSVLPLIRGDRARAARLRAAGLAPVQFAYGGALDIFTRMGLARSLAAFAPRVAVAWMGRAARHAPTGPWVLVGRLGGKYDLRRFRRCDHLVGNTRGMVDWIVQSGWPQARAHLLPNFVADAAGAAPTVLPVPPRAPTVLALGRLHRNKGFDVLLEAVSRLPSVHAVIAGEGPEGPALERLARQAGIAGRVHFLGWRDDTASLLAACDLLVCPSRVEPLGNVILEAFSAGKPVVAAMAEGPLELISPGRNGVLVAVESGIALAAGIDSILQNPVLAESLGRTARRNYEASFSETAVLARWRAFLAGVEKA